MKKGDQHSTSNVQRSTFKDCTQAKLVAAQEEVKRSYRLLDTVERDSSEVPNLQVRWAKAVKALRELEAEMEYVARLEKREDGAAQEAVTKLREELSLAVEELAQAMGLSREGDETLESNPDGAKMCFSDASDLLMPLAERIQVCARRAEVLSKGGAL